MKHLSILLSTFLLVMIIRRQPYRRTSRSISTLAPIYTTLKHHIEDGGNDYNDYKGHNEAWITFVRQAVQPGLTELEAQQIVEIILTHQPFPADDLGPVFERLTKSSGASR